MNYELKHSSPPKALLQLACMCESWGKGVGGEHGVPWKATETATNVYLQVVTRVQQVLCCNSDTPHVYPDQDGDTMLSCLFAGHQNCTLSATKPLAHSKKEGKKETRSLSVHANSIDHHPRGYAAWGTYNISLSFIRKWGIFSRVPKSGCTSK